MIAMRPLVEGAPLFQGPLTIRNVSRPVMVDAGDFDKDGKLDLVAVNGSDITLVLLQNPSDRSEWKPIELLQNPSDRFLNHVKVRVVKPRPTIGDTPGRGQGAPAPC